MHRAVLCLAATTLAGCAAGDPLRAIPAHERTMLEAEARVAGAGRDRRAAVSAMLARARADDPGPLVLRFEGQTIQPDAAQREAIARFAAAARGAPTVIVAAQPGLGGGRDMLGARRALAVSRLLEGQFQEVELRFETGLPAEVVRVLLPAVPVR